MKAITQHFYGSTEDWKAANPKLYNAVWGFEETKEGKIYAKLGNGKDRWNDLKYFDTENIHGLIEKFSGIWEAIDAESVARTEADSILQENINAEIETRTAADIILQENIDAEIETRTAADIILQENIDSETETRTAADITLQENIDSETTEREAADAALREAITALAPEGLDDIPAQFNALQEAIRTEAVTRATDDLTLKDNIDREVETRAEEDSALQDKILLLENNISELESNILERLFPIGSGYTQGINDPTPIEAGLPGTWQKWTGKAEAYRLTTAALPSYTTYTAGANYAANAYVLWHLNGSGWELFKAKAAITNAVSQLDPVLWEKYTTGTIVERRLLQGWLDNDLSIGSVISGGSYNGQRVSEVIVRGGTFPSWEGGNRPTFKSGGVAADRIRNISGSIDGYFDFMSTTGVFINVNNTYVIQSVDPNILGYHSVLFQASRVVPTGNDNAPRTLSDCFWRRVA